MADGKINVNLKIDIINTRNKLFKNRASVYYIGK